MKTAMGFARFERNEPSSAPPVAAARTAATGVAVRVR